MEDYLFVKISKIYPFLFSKIDIFIKEAHVIITMKIVVAHFEQKQPNKGVKMKPSIRMNAQVRWLADDYHCVIFEQNFWQDV